MRNYASAFYMPHPYFAYRMRSLDTQSSPNSLRLFTLTQLDKNSHLTDY